MGLRHLELVCDTFSESFDGLLIKDDKGFRVVCNIATGNDDSTPRGRFTIAHELGHYFLDEHRTIIEKCLLPSFGEKAINDNEMEREADLFASRLLMPTELVKSACKKSRGGLKGIQKLAERFSVSMKCAAIRYVGDDIAPCCLTFRDWEGELRWKWFSRSLWIGGIRKLQAAPVRNGATDQVISRGLNKESDVISTGAPAQYLFSGIDGKLYHEIFTEDAMALGEYGVLTLLSSQKSELTAIAEILDKRWARD